MGQGESGGREMELTILEQQLKKQKTLTTGNFRGTEMIPLDIK